MQQAAIQDQKCKYSFWKLVFKRLHSDVNVCNEVTLQPAALPAALNGNRKGYKQAPAAGLASITLWKTSYIQNMYDLIRSYLCI